MNELEEINAEIERLEARKLELYKQSLNSPDEEKLLADWLAGALIDTSRARLTYPIAISGIHVAGSYATYRKPALVKVRPCGNEFEGKTFLGVLVGDLPRGLSVSVNTETKVLHVENGWYNPAIIIPSRQRIVFGAESWWGEIKRPEDFEEITDEDINNVPYVQALKHWYNEHTR